MLLQPKTVIILFSTPSTQGWFSNINLIWGLLTYQSTFIPIGFAYMAQTPHSFVIQMITFESYLSYLTQPFGHSA